LSFKIIRWGGLATVVAAALYIVTDLVTFFLALPQGPPVGALFQAIVTSVAQVLLLLGIVALYAQRSEAAGIPGLIAFIVTFAGTVWAHGGVFWATLLAALGWILFGVNDLRAQVYPRAAAIVLIIGALLYGIAHALIGSGALGFSPIYIGAFLVFNIIFYTAIAWLGDNLYIRGSKASTEG